MEKVKDICMKVDGEMKPSRSQLFANCVAPIRVCG